MLHSNQINHNISFSMLVVLLSFKTRYTIGCDRSLSRKARRILDELVFSEIEIDPTELPVECPFNPSHDLYLEQESFKSIVRTTQWRCDKCGKTFKSEFYLDRHFDNKHSDILSHDAPVCLGEFCDVLGCEGTSHIHGKKVILGANGGCHPREMELAKLRCQASFHKCFPLEEGEISEIYYNTFNDEICERLSCDQDPQKGFFHNLDRKPQDDILVERERLVNSQAIKVGLSSVFFIILIIYYAYLVYYKRETSTTKDFQRRVTSKGQRQARKLD
mmetsp:Transcript_20107/g.26561  ORF Transcript_20107/g.26561 Transcript_20107/m.26561 type:complete len:275 (-) Transcript_20107:453-1277(-)